MSRRELDRDPGWRPVVRWLPMLVVPMLGMRTMVKQDDGLLSLRMLWAIFVWAAVVVGIIVAALAAADVELGSSLDRSAGLAGVIVLGASAQLLAVRFAPLLDFADEGAFVGSFQRATLVRIGFAEAAAVIGLVGFLMTGSAFVYGVSFVISLAGHLDAMPGRRRLDAAQAEAVAANTSIRVVRALRANRLTQ